MARAEKRKYHYIYKTTCVITNKFYIGMHSTDNLEDGYQGSGKILWYSIRKHGKENHKTEIIEFVSSREELRLREKQLVNEELINVDSCMNLKLGGEGGWDYVNLTPKPREWHQAGARAVNKIRTKRHLELLKNDEDYRDRYCRAVSEGALRNSSRPDYVNPNLGNKYSDEVRQNMSNLNKGEKNSQFGTCWIYSVIENKSVKILKDELESYTELGWLKGRKLFVKNLNNDSISLQNS